VTEYVDMYGEDLPEQAVMAIRDTDGQQEAFQSSGSDGGGVRCGGDGGPLRLCS